MKMSPLLWRVVSVWLCLAVVCRYPSYYVAGAESNQETQRPTSSQDVGSEEGTGQKTPHPKLEKSSSLPAQPLYENELLLEDNQPKEEQTTQNVEKKEQYPEVFKVKATAKAEEEEDKEILQSEPKPEHHDTSVVQEQDSAARVPSPDPVAAGLKDNLSILNLQDSIPNSALDEASDVAVPEIPESDLPPHCEDESNPYDSDSSPPIVLENTSNVHTAGTKSHTDPPLSSPTSPGPQHLEANKSHVLKKQDQSSPGTADTDSSVSSKDPEDIPTFDEWKRKMMEVEKEKTQSTHTSNNGGSHAVKKVQKNFNNYASVECGAKILGSNPEAKSTSSILKENMDLYMLNPCSNKIWFIIELCEPIQVKQLDIANFELFSSTPKDFLVSISDRYPTNKWLKLGTFHGKDERTVQSFPLDEHLYAKYVKMFTKYIKVELLSHFGSEHFCPLSLIRVFGTSMVEEYEEIADPSERPDDQDDDVDYPPGYPAGDVKLSKNLIGSAKDVILNMVSNIAVNVLGGGPDMQGNISSHEVNMTQPSVEPETTTPTTTEDLTSGPDTEEVEISPDPDIPPTAAPSAETPVSETLDAEASKQECPPVEDKVVIPLEKDEEEPISSTITFMDKEEESDDDKEKRDHHKRQHENLNNCSLPLFSSSCSCAASLQEYLHQQCSALLSKKSKCQTTDSRQMTPIETPTLHLPLPHSVSPEPQLHHSEIQLREKEQASEEEPESGASTSEAPQPPGSTIETHKESMSQPPVLEPSQTLSLPKSSATDSSAAKPIVETPLPSSEETVKELRPEKSQDVPAVEKYTKPSVSLSSSVTVKRSDTLDDVSVKPTEDKPHSDVSRLETSTPVPIPDNTDQSQVLLPTTSLHVDHHPDQPTVPESSIASTEPPHPAPDTLTELEPSGGPPVIKETKSEDLPEDVSSPSVGNGQLPRPPSSLSPSSLTSPSLSDIYAETPNGTEQNGNLLHGSSQKESVFMRLNNRIKALEMNMSLSGRYLEQLSQRYRKQMEEMQKAFNKTIIKLQNTSRIAEEQDLRQTESIQLLQGQLENMTQLVLNLSVRVSQLQSEVSDRQNYLLLSLALCVCLGLMLCANCCRISAIPLATEPESPIPKSYAYCCPESGVHHAAGDRGRERSVDTASSSRESPWPNDKFMSLIESTENNYTFRQFSFCDETGLKRSASYPLIHSESLQLSTTEGPEVLHPEETHNLCPGNRKRRRRKIKPMEKVETLKPSLHAAPGQSNGAVICNGVPITTNPKPLTKRLLQPTFRDSPPEGSSEGSSHSDDPSFCGITTACSRICDGLPLPKTRAEKRTLRRQHPKPSCAVMDLLQAPKRDRSEPLPISTIEDIMRKTEKSSGTFRVNVALSGPV